MRIKLVILDQNEEYLERLSTLIRKQYMEKFELNWFTRLEALDQYVKKNNFDILLISDVFKDYQPGKGIKVYFVEKAGITKINNEPALCKYQSVDNLYRQLIQIMADHGEDIQVQFGNTDVCGRVVAFSSFEGGTGKTTMAVAYARKQVTAGKKVVYLSTEDFPVMNLIFQGKSEFGLSDVFYALKSKRGNLSMKLAGAVQTDPNGIYFFSDCVNPVELQEMEGEDWGALVRAIQEIRIADIIVLDMPGGISEKNRLLWNQADVVAMVTKYDSVTQYKLYEMMLAVNTLDNQENHGYVRKLRFIGNQCDDFPINAEIGITTGNMLGCFPYKGICRLDEAINAVLSDGNSNLLLKL